MKKIIIAIFMISFSVFGSEMDECFKDALTNGAALNPMSPREQCSETIKSHPDRVEAKLKGYHLYGLKNMMYLEKDGKIDLLAGSETLLEHIVKIEVDVTGNRILILQKDSISTFKLDFIGNVTPERHFKSHILKGATGIKITGDKKKIIIYSDIKEIILNSDSESRKEVGEKKSNISVLKRESLKLSGLP